MRDGVKTRDRHGTGHGYEWVVPLRGLGKVRHIAFTRYQSTELRDSTDKELVIRWAKEEGDRLGDPVAITMEQAHDIVDALMMAICDAEDLRYKRGAYAEE